IAFLLKVSGTFSRGSVFAFFGTGLIVVAGLRVFAPRWLAERQLQSAFAGRDVLVIGARNQTALQSLKEAMQRAGCQPTVIEVVADSDAPAEFEARRVRDLAMDLARTSGHGEIYVAAGGIPDSLLKPLLLGLQKIPRSVRLVPDAATERLFHFPVTVVGQTVAVELQKAPLNRLQRAIKRGIDLTIAVPALVVLSPFMAAIAALIAMGSRGPVFFRQERLGYRGKPFAILKFRTMTVLENGEEIEQARQNDWRVTRVGAWLRRASLDELPQLINVVRGQMSLVGPRPHASAHDAFYSKLIPNYELRQHVKPGITGWAQVNGYRGETPTVDTMEKRIEFDVWYAKNQSVMLDWQILLRTIVEVFRQRNAY
ncbi:MAG TPA: exopolysaccharide biosynthesis polyprenyl glycosylphosphotransferase, partial [Burkholderiales bacterium]|nr:exopolysaccharide biosynthesis polyprenyl glycosylphosphotransferase [Burkholderiales bacterium]